MASSTNNSTAAGAGTYLPNSTVPLTIGTLEEQTSPYTGSVDETALYGSALTPAQMLSHFNTISSSTPGTYQAIVRSGSAILQLSNNVPEPASMLLVGGFLLLLRQRLAR